MGNSVVDALILDLLDWISSSDKTYEEVMDVWRTSCPQLPVWEDATDRGLVAKQYVSGGCVVKITASGRKLLEERKLSKPGFGIPRSGIRQATIAEGH